MERSASCTTALKLPPNRRAYIEAANLSAGALGSRPWTVGGRPALKLSSE